MVCVSGYLERPIQTYTHKTARVFQESQTESYCKTPRSASFTQRRPQLDAQPNCNVVQSSIVLDYRGADGDLKRTSSTLSAGFKGLGARFGARF